MVENIPKSFEETILSYLRGQEICLEDTFHVNLVEKDEYAGENVQGILNDLLLKVEKRIACKDRYENLKLWHNQYPLFDLNDFILDFCMDEEMMKKLAFRETLLVSELESISNGTAEPNPVGGLCVNVSLVDGYVPEASTKKFTNAEMDCEILQTWQRAKQASLNTKYSPSDAEGGDLENKLQEKLKEYESFLKNEMKANVKKFVVHLSSQFDVGLNGGSRVTAWVDRQLHTLEEKRTEYVSEEDAIMNEKTVYVAIQDNKYYLRTTSSKEEYEERKYYSFAKTRHLVAEGANFILMRYLAIIRYVGKFELSTIYINGDLCRNIYVMAVI